MRFKKVVIFGVLHGRDEWIQVSTVAVSGEKEATSGARSSSPSHWVERFMVSRCQHHFRAAGHRLLIPSRILPNESPGALGFVPVSASMALWIGEREEDASGILRNKIYRKSGKECEAGGLQ